MLLSAYRASSKGGCWNPVSIIHYCVFGHVSLRSIRSMLALYQVDLLLLPLVLVSCAWSRAVDISRAASASTSVTVTSSYVSLRLALRCIRHSVPQCSLSPTDAVQSMF